MSDFDTKRDGIPVRVVETGEEFNSIQACANRLGVNSKWLARIVRGDSKVYSCHGYHVVPIDRVNNGFEEQGRGRPGRKVGILESGEEFPSARECARSIKGDHKSVLRAARKNREYKERHFKIIT